MAESSGPKDEDGVEVARLLGTRIRRNRVEELEAEIIDMYIHEHAAHQCQGKGDRHTHGNSDTCPWRYPHASHGYFDRIGPLGLAFLEEIRLTCQSQQPANQLFPQPQPCSQACSPRTSPNRRFDPSLSSTPSRSLSCTAQHTNLSQTNAIRLSRLFASLLPPLQSRSTPALQTEQRNDPWVTSRRPERPSHPVPGAPTRLKH